MNGSISCVFFGFKGSNLLLECFNCRTQTDLVYSQFLDLVTIHISLSSNNPIP